MKTGIMQFKKRALSASLILAISGAALAATSPPTESVKGHKPAYNDIGIQFHDLDGNKVASVGDTLSVTKGIFNDQDGDSENSSTYQWYSDGSPIGGATGDSYTLSQGDIGHTIKVGVIAHTDPTVTDPADGDEMYSSHGGATDGSDNGNGSVVTDANDVVSVVISGMSGANPLVNETLTATATCTSGSVCSGPVNYQWQIETTPGSGSYQDIGSNTNTYTVQGTDQKRKIQVIATKQ
ncbi:ZirU family protein [Edwardsiella tarda]|uniref:Invasin family protein n=2 Tax=Edwardsiella tarda TaxID=636 RepID=A0A2A7U0X1_EDWTA|nr:ZirU family protein [Edwardsiella tarda]AKH88305.1 ZirU family protein [Edwardsiella tarda]ATI64901.1 invasin family protein [Edwardsiella tarda]EFE21833.1 hypothetical protein EDWATA_03179 [Edwardsiella tarda ATCC 23685]PEH71873.1 invasin family protein [Edwardsiella tarda]UCQ12030.1 ZirU family protein [Edwardsiella tarda]